MPVENDSLAVIRAQTGRQNYIFKGTGAESSNGDRTRFLDVGPLSPGTYTGYIPVAGTDYCRIINKPLTVTGAVTATVFRTLADNATQDPTDVGVALTLAAGTANADIVSGYAGVKMLLVQIIVPGGGSLDFTTGLCEFQAMRGGTSEAHLGEVGGNSKLVKLPLVVTAALYAAGNCVGGLLAITNAVRLAGKAAILQSLLLTDRAKQNAAMDLVIFDANPAGSTLTDKVAAVIVAADVPKIIRRIGIFASDYATPGGAAGVVSSVVDNSPGGRVLLPAAGTTLWAALITSGTPTYATTADLELNLGLLRD